MRVKLIAASATVGLLAFAGSAYADPAGAPNNTGTGQSSASNGSNGTSSASGQTNSDNDADRQRDRAKREAAARAAMERAELRARAEKERASSTRKARDEYHRKRLARKAALDQINIDEQIQYDHPDLKPGDKAELGDPNRFGNSVREHNQKKREKREAEEAAARAKREEAEALKDYQEEMNKELFGD